MRLRLTLRRVVQSYGLDVDLIILTATKQFLNILQNIRQNLLKI